MTDALYGTLADAGRQALDAVFEMCNLSRDLDQLVKRRLCPEEAPGYRGMAASLLMWDAVDECEGKEINDDRWLVRLATIGAFVLLDELEWEPYKQREKARHRTRASA
jgi:hypothetical protein